MNAETSRPNAVIVLGMHRSGTSAVAGALGVVGVALGSRLVAAAADNPKGYWEHADAVQLHETLLSALGSAWEDPRELPAGWAETDAGRAAARAASDLIDREFADGPLWAIKDPRQCRLLPAWQEAFAAHGIRPAYLLVLRHPAEVADSLHRRDGLSRAHAALLWTRHLLDADRDSAGAPRMLLEFDRLMAAPAAALDRIAAGLDVAWPLDPDLRRAELAAFLDSGLRHHRRAADALSGSPAEAIADAAYQCCLAAVADGRWPDLTDTRRALQALAPEAIDATPGLVRAIARERGRQQGLEARLAAAEEGLEQARALSLERLDELLALNDRLARTDLGLAEAKRLSLERLDELARLDGQLHAANRELEEAKTLSLQRLAASEEQALRASREAERAERESALAEQASRRADLAEERVRAMEQSRSWRLTRPLRSFNRWWHRVWRRGAE